MPFGKNSLCGRRNLSGRNGSCENGLNQTDAKKRVSEVFVEIQRSIETARKAVAHLSLWIFVALLIGAFCASYAATIGGSQRDHVELV